MNQQDLIDAYGIAAHRLHSVVAEIHEDLFGEDGRSPIIGLDDVNELIANHRKTINLELQMIREAVKQYEESN